MRLEFQRLRGFPARVIGQAHERIQARCKSQRFHIVRLGLERLTDLVARPREVALLHQLARLLQRRALQGRRSGRATAKDTGDKRVSQIGLCRTGFRQRILGCLRIALRGVGVGQVLVQRIGCRLQRERRLHVGDGLGIALLLEFQPPEHGRTDGDPGVLRERRFEHFVRAVQVALVDQCIGQAIADRQIILIQRQGRLEIRARFGFALLRRREYATQIDPARVLRRELSGVVESKIRNVQQPCVEIQRTHLGVGHS